MLLTGAFAVATDCSETAFLSKNVIGKVVPVLNYLSTTS
jgi:hypothetical protein